MKDARRAAAGRDRRPGVADVHDGQLAGSDRGDAQVPCLGAGISVDQCLAAEHRGHGLGRLLAQRAVVEAVQIGVTKLVVDVVAEQAATVSMFSKLGFEAEALFKDHVKDQHGETHDLLVLISGSAPVESVNLP